MADPTNKSVDVESKDFALHLDEQDPLRDLRNEFLIPSKADLRSTTLPQHGE